MECQYENQCEGGGGASLQKRHATHLDHQHLPPIVITTWGRMSYSPDFPTQDTSEEPLLMHKVLLLSWKEHILQKITLSILLHILQKRTKIPRTTNDMIRILFCILLPIHLLWLQMSPNTPHKFMGFHLCKIKYL